ncbi:hypothetical protein FA95DRAFT_1609829 [Auriscalpium vulgare]|uniref:Uncharacterized protein n=1 Tax=Auriscalpium vulgare TaxID=40419 RepID=A0ACB8RFT7_9AGAM|nr:hypothetical protein FA95DRAFT_1609829 [Auriscalpium vulgare]
MSPYGMPQLPFMPFAGGGYAGSAVGSDFGGNMPVAPMAFQNTGSVYGMMGAGVPRNTMMTNFGGGMFACSAGAPGGSPAHSLNNGAGRCCHLGHWGAHGRYRRSRWQPLRNYLRTQDLMTLTKKTAREAIMARFPAADLTPRKAFLQGSIDTILLYLHELMEADLHAIGRDTYRGRWNRPRLD